MTRHLFLLTKKNIFVYLFKCSFGGFDSGDLIRGNGFGGMFSGDWIRDFLFSGEWIWAHGPEPSLLLFAEIFPSERNLLLELVEQSLDSSIFGIFRSRCKCSNKEEIDPEKLLGYKVTISNLNDFLDFENKLKDDEEKIQKMVFIFQPVKIQELIAANSRFLYYVSEKIHRFHRLGGKERQTHD